MLFTKKIQSFEDTRSLLDQLLLDSKLFKKTADYKALLDFVVKLRNFAPFNAMLLQIQKPGLSYAASAKDWWQKFRRTPKEGARPLLIMWPFGPVALAYDVDDTEGDPLPEDVAAFLAYGEIDEGAISSFKVRLSQNGIRWNSIDAGGFTAGSIQRVNTTDGSESPQYLMSVNRNHSPVVQFATLIHELAHLFLGHLGDDKNLHIRSRTGLIKSKVELEAESISYLICARNGVKSKSEAYLQHYVKDQTTIDEIDLYLIMRLTGQIESLLGLPLKSDKKPIVRPRQASLFG